MPFTHRFSARSRDPCIRCDTHLNRTEQAGGEEWLIVTHTGPLGEPGLTLLGWQIAVGDEAIIPGVGHFDLHCIAPGPHMLGDVDLPWRGPCRAGFLAVHIDLAHNRDLTQGEHDTGAKLIIAELKGGLIDGGAGVMPNGIVGMFGPVDQGFKGRFAGRTRNPEELRNMTPEQRADWIKRSVEGPLKGEDEGKELNKLMDRPFGEWNSLQITMIGERVTVILNGEVVVDNAVMENYFDEERKTPIFARGPIQLQTRGGETRWRNIFIREISAEEANAVLGAATSAEHGFTRLDNGKDLTGWIDAVDGYEVVDGAIVCQAKKGGNLLTAEEYGDLHLAVEFKLPLAGNNGIALRTPPNSSPAWDGLEVQILDSKGYEATKGPLKPYQVHGSLYALAPAARGFLRPTGEWNYQEIKLVGQHLKVILNGTKILDVNMDEIDTTGIRRVPKGLHSRRGHVGFVGHTDPVAFRNFRIKRLD